jgi:hypothetical protein
MAKELPRKWHRSITAQRVIDAVECDNGEAFCAACGEEYGDYLEGDARGVKCPSCDEPMVFGSHEYLMSLPL